MRVGLQVSAFNWPGGTNTIGNTFKAIGQTADEAGFDSLWVMDHFFQIAMIGQASDPMLEGYAALNYLAGVTQRVRLGTLVTGVHYRHPGILLKTVTALDVLSGGRAYLGIGAGWFEQESRGLGVPFPSTSERFEQLEETLQLAHQMWRDDATPYEGKHFQLAEPMNHPQPLSQPHPPILIGGQGEQKTLRMVAQYGDACNLFARAGAEALQAKFDVLKGHCERLGRDYNTIEKTVLDVAMLAPGAMSASDVVAHCKNLAAIGVQHVIFGLPNVHELTPLETFKREIIPALRDL
ncbi:MAG: LLM class F420-dependent oxidoreductase [Chloroflexaceae bacterium]|nr:LLM class F420-dependent oxidoreductase [Chloroflexaceae bacterium]